MKATWAGSGLLVLVAAQLGCDARAGSDYEGESLLSIEGNVVINDPSAPSELEPAIAFRDETRTLHILDVEARGEFPANFRLDVLDRPPPEALLEPTAAFPVATADDPRFALAYIAAVAPGHPERIALPGKTYVFGCEHDGVLHPPTDLSMFDPAFPPLSGQPGSTCTRETKACTQDESSCYVRVESCDHMFQNCVVTSLSGDPELLKTTTAEQFAGLSSNYLLLYLEKHAPAGSTTAKMFGRGERLRAGYHLLEVRDYNEAELAAYRASWDPAGELAYARFNEAHGTNYSPAQEPSSETELLELSRTFFTTAMDRGCPAATFSIEPVERLRRRKISIVVGQSEAPPSLWD